MYRRDYIVASTGADMHNRFTPDTNPALIRIPPCLWAITFLTLFPIMPFLILFKVVECGGSY